MNDTEQRKAARAFAYIKAGCSAMRRKFGFRNSLMKHKIMLNIPACHKIFMERKFLRFSQSLAGSGLTKRKTLNP